MRGWVLAVLVVATACGGSSGSGEDDAGADSAVFDSGYDAGSRDAGVDARVDAGHDASVDAGHDAGADAGAFDAGFDSGTPDAGYDAGAPCECSSAGPCCDGCHFKAAGTLCAAQFAMATCAGTGTHVRKDFTGTACNAVGQCSVSGSGAYAYFACSGSCPGGTSCLGSCVNVGAQHCVVQSPSCEGASRPELYDLGICP